jgi:hypothetical protein
MPNSDNSVGLSRSRLRRRILAAAAGVCLILAIVIFFGVGPWLVVEDPPVKSRAIVILSGAMPLRAIEAAKLYRQGYAPEIWLTHSAEPGETLEEMHIPFYGEDHYNQLVLIHDGVPPEAIHILEPPIVNTADEIIVTAAALAQENARENPSANADGSKSGVASENTKAATSRNNATVILVTTKAHTRRVHLLWRRLAPGQFRVIVRAAAADPFDPRHWWRTTGDALDVVRELLGLLNAYAGLPLRPAR